MTKVRNTVAIEILRKVSTFYPTIRNACAENAFVITDIFSLFFSRECFHLVDTQEQLKTLIAVYRTEIYLA